MHESAKMAKFNKFTNLCSSQERPVLGTQLPCVSNIKHSNLADSNNHHPNKHHPLLAGQELPRNSILILHSILLPACSNKISAFSALSFIHLILGVQEFWLNIYLVL